MARANPSVRKLLAAAVAPVVERNGGPPKVAEKVGRHRSTVTRWVKGDIDWDGLAALASGTRTEIVITFPAHGQPKANAKEPPGISAEGLKDSLDEVARLLRLVLDDPVEDPPETPLEELATLPERLERAKRQAKRTRGRK